MNTLQTPSTAQGVSWDLHDLYQSADDPKLDADLESARQRASAFETAYRGKIATLAVNSGAVLARAVAELESLYEQMDRPSIYAHLLHAGKTDDPKHGALVARTSEKRTVCGWVGERRVAVEAAE